MNVEIIMRKTCLLLVAGMMALVLNACGWLVNDDSGYFRDRSNDYQQAKVLPPLQIPEGVDASTTDALLVIPASNAQVKKKTDFVLPAPPRLATTLYENSLRIQKLGSQRWLLMDKSPEALWPRVRDFLLSNNLPIAAERGADGRIDTGWLLSNHNQAIRERFRFKVTAGVQRKTAEVHIVQQQMPKIQSALAQQWSLQSSDVTREYWMLEQLGEYLVSQTGAPSISLLAQNISASPKLRKTTDVGVPALELDLAYPRAWASVALALRKAHFSIITSNAETGVYQLVYTPPASEDDQPGAISRLFGAKPKLYADEPFAGDHLAVKVTRMRGKTGVIVKVIASKMPSLDDEGAKVETKAYSLEQQEALLNLFQGYLS